MRLKSLFVLSTLVLAPVLYAQTLRQTISIPATVTLVHPSPSCTFSTPQAIDISATLPCPSCPRDWSTIGSGSFSLSGNHATNWTVTIAPLPASASLGSNTLPITVTAWRNNPATSGTALGVTYSFSAGPWGFDVQSRNVPSTTTVGTYTASITATGTCS